MKIKLLFYSLLISLLFVSCTDEFDMFNDDLKINSDWKEFVFLYSNISPSDSIHFIRVNRGFLGGNFFDMSNCIDSIQYKPEDLSVTFQVLRNNRLFKSYVCSDTLINKQSGEYFNVGNVRAYYFRDAEIPCELGDVYKLVVKTKSNKTVTAETHPVTNFTPIYYETSHGAIDLNSDNYIVVQTLLPEYGQVYNIVLKIYYHEILPGNIKKYYVVKSKVFDQVNDDFVVEHDGETKLHLGYSATEISNAVIRDIESRGVVNVTARVLDSLSYIILSGNNDMANIYKNKVPVTGFDIDIVGYSNVKNGYGAFTSYSYFLSKKFGFTPKSLSWMSDNYGEYGF